jgi:hypothetical protein
LTASSPPLPVEFTHPHPIVTMQGRRSLKWQALM